MIIDRDALERVEQLVNEVADEYDEFPQDVCDELNKITGNDWSCEEYLEYCAGYWESPWNLEEVVYALFNHGEFPQRTISTLYAWIPNQIDMSEDDVISFFRFGKYREISDVTALFYDIDYKGLFDDLRARLVEWKCDGKRLEKSSYTSSRFSKNDSYGYEKVIDINANYSAKFLNISLKNMNGNEINELISIVNKWTGLVWLVKS